MPNDQTCCNDVVNGELVAAGTAKMLMAGDIRSRCAAVHEVLGRLALKTLVDGHSKLILERIAQGRHHLCPTVLCRYNNCDSHVVLFKQYLSRLNQLSSRLQCSCDYRARFEATFIGTQHSTELEENVLNAHATCQSSGLRLGKC